MEKKFKSAVLIMILLLAGNCIDLGIYVSKIPLGSPGSFPADPGLAGSWERSSESKDENGIKTLKIVLFNKNELLLSSGDGGDTSVIRAFITRISGISFLNIQEPSENEREYVFCKYNLIDGKELRLHFISDKLFDQEKPSTEKKLREFIEKKLSDPALFNDEMKFSFKRISQ